MGNKSVWKGIVIGTAFALSLSLTGIVDASSKALKGYFTDKGWWSENAEWAKDEGLMNGRSETRFDGDEPVTRGEMATILKNLSTKGKLVSSDSSQAIPIEPSPGTDHFLKEPLGLQLSQAQVKAMMGKSSHEGTDSAAGRYTVWRYDVGAIAGYSFDSLGDSVDIQGLKDKKVEMQILYMWNQAGELVDVVYYMAKGNDVFEFKVDGILQKI